VPPKNDETLNIIEFANLETFPYKDSCMTIGNFDGVHRGHQALINELARKASAHANPVIVITFFPNPSDFFQPNIDSFYLSTPAEKEAELCHLGIDRVITFRFDQDFANLTAREFLSALKQKLGLTLLVLGEDFALGKDRQGTIDVIRSIGQEMSFAVETIAPINLGSETISSTKIRQCLDEGNLACAAKMLGRPYAISGVVTQGSDRGSRIGLPTANMTHWSKKKLPAIGVYATRVVVNNGEYFGITNVGYRPTFEEQALPNIETHILDFDGNIYGETLEIKLIQKIRDEQKFSGVEAFLAQIERDKATARRIFSNDETQTNLLTQP